MLVLLYFNQRGYTAIEVAMLFLFYEIFGIVTNQTVLNDQRLGQR